MTLNLITKNDKYALGLIDKVADNRIAYLFNNFTNTVLIKQANMDLSIWLKSRKPLTVWPIVKKEFIRWMDKFQKFKETSKKIGLYVLMQLIKTNMEMNSPTFDL